MVVAGGKSIISHLFERDKEKSTHHKPARKLAGGIFTGVKTQKGDYSTFKLNTFPNIGEIFQFPFYDKAKGASCAFVFEACPDGAMAPFLSIKNGQEFVEQSKKLIKEFVPSNYEAVQDMELTDENAWLCGAITPTVKKPIGKLPSGAIVMGIGDTVILNDPIAGQGANNANKIAHLMTQRIIEHGNRRFNAEWMQAVFDEFWAYVQHSNALCDCLLVPQSHHQDIIVAAAKNPSVARDYFNGINHPPSLFPWFFEAQAASDYLAEKNAVVPFVVEA